MKVIFFRHSLLNRGGDKMVLAYANHLARAGHEVIFYVGQVDTHFLISDKITINRIQPMFKVATVFFALTHKFKADIVIADIMVLAFLLNLLNTRRVLYFAQDYDVYYYRNPFSRLFVYLMYVMGMKFLKIPTLAVSDGLKARLRQFHQDIYVVNNGVDPHIFFPRRAKEYLTLKEDRRAILIHARNDTRKGTDLAVEVFRKMRDGGIELWVVGEYLQDPAIQVKIRNFGYVPENELARIISSADLLLYPSRHEGFGLLALEAAACGCPVVTTRAVKILAHGHTAWMASKENHAYFLEGIKTVLFERRFREKIIEGGIHLARQYNIRESGIQFERILKKLIGNNSHERQCHYSGI